jgi:DNA-binding MarR family transcriptional regulator
MNLECGFGFLVHEVWRLFARRFDARALDALGLTRTQCRLLGHLARHEGIHQAGLADLLEIKPMTLVRQIDRMEQDGWVERRPDPSDRRARRLMLTDKARPIVAGIAGLSAELRAEAFAGFGVEEGDDLIDLLQRVRANLATPAAAPRGDGAATPARPIPPRLRAMADLLIAGDRP